MKKQIRLDKLHVLNLRINKDDELEYDVIDFTGHIEGEYLVKNAVIAGPIPSEVLVVNIGKEHVMLIVNNDIPVEPEDSDSYVGVKMVLINKKG